MKLLITRSTKPHFYKTDPELQELKVINFGRHDLCQPTWELERALPPEITTMICQQLFLIYLQTFNFDQAAALVSVHKTFANDIYDCIYGRSVLSVTTKINRICNTLNLLEMLHDSYMTCDRISKYTLCRVVRRKFNGKYYPWDLVHECFACPISGVISDDAPVQQYETGTLNGDNVWLTGTYLKNGIYECQRFKHPVINLEFTNFYDMNLCTSRYLRRDQFIKQFVKLIKLTYGANTGVHIMFNDSGDGNPFDMSSTGFIEY
jgi:hypothetical protein